MKSSRNKCWGVPKRTRRVSTTGRAAKDRGAQHPQAKYRRDPGRCGRQSEENEGNKSNTEGCRPIHARTQGPHGGGPWALKGKSLLHRLATEANDAHAWPSLGPAWRRPLAPGAQYNAPTDDYRPRRSGRG